jgi:hypothetical protein
VEFELGGGEALDELERSLAEAPAAETQRDNGTVTVRDPDGQMLAFTQP